MNFKVQTLNFKLATLIAFGLLLVVSAGCRKIAPALPGLPTATNTITMTHTISPTFTETPEDTPTNTPTVTPTYTYTGTYTISPTFTFTSSFTASSTATYTSTLTCTPSVTPTATATPTNTNVAPEITAVFPANVPDSGGTEITITGSGFQAGFSLVIGALSVPVSDLSFISEGALQAITPAQPAGTYDIYVENPDGQGHTLNAAFTYIAPPPPPSITFIDPVNGPAAGGTVVTVYGSDFMLGFIASIGGVSLSGTQYISSSEIRGTTGAHSAGLADVYVMNPDGQSDTLPDGFTYQ